ncbi:MAG TPA: hypothetical protein VIU12_03855 [Chryseolinea sp.]
MPRLIPAGRIMFALGMLGLAFICILAQDFIIGRPPALPAQLIGVAPLLGYVLAGVVALSALAIIIDHKYAAYGALVIGFLILVSLLFRQLPNFMTDWLNALKSFFMVGGSIIIAATYTGEQRALKTLSDKTWDVLIYVGCVFLAAFFIAGGYSHFLYAEFVKGFIPAYIPFHTFFTYFCAICLFAGGIGILIPATRRLAALLSGIMVFGWFLLLHIPRFFANMNDPSDRMGLCESFAFAGFFFALTGLSERKK